ncbi:hypothetical protein [Pendulispora albinea]|uniref:Tetratricopeptide repeat protein n=1 Tax=Pendulispora albinea TaxID=2741071 RepID=A0ABZ2LSE3_9BACT
MKRIGVSIGRTWSDAVATAAAPLSLLLFIFLSLLVGCGGHEARTLKMRTALDEGHPQGAIGAINDELDVKTSKELPADLQGDNALLVLDRASIQQSLAQFPESSRDFESADKAIDMLDLSRNASDSIAKYVFSDSAGRYKAPPYEKLLINTLNMINYLERGDLNGARVEARRLNVMQRYVVDTLEQKDNPVIGLGGFLAGLVFEKSGQPDEALRYYDEALAFNGFGSLRNPTRLLLQNTSYKSPRLAGLAGTVANDGPVKPLDQTGEGEIILVIGYGRVPHKVANRIPIGLALTYFSSAINPGDREAANKLAATGAATWINYPSLAQGQGNYAIPTAMVDGRSVPVEEAVDVDHQVREEWHKIEGSVVASAITRMIARVAVGEGVKTVAGRDSTVGFLAAIGSMVALTVADTPDTRSWETLPARVAVTRMRVPAGKHTIRLDARGVSRTAQVNLEKGGWSLVSLMALR